MWIYRWTCLLEFGWRTYILISLRYATIWLVYKDFNPSVRRRGDEGIIDNGVREDVSSDCERERRWPVVSVSSRKQPAVRTTERVRPGGGRPAECFNFTLALALLLTRSQSPAGSRPTYQHRPPPHIRDLGDFTVIITVVMITIYVDVWRWLSAARHTVSTVKLLSYIVLYTI